MRNNAATALLAISLTIGLHGCGGKSSPTESAGEVANPGTNAHVARPSVSADVVQSDTPWEFDGARGRIIQTPHFRIFTTQLEPMLVDRLPGFLESALLHYRTSMSPSAPSASTSSPAIELLPTPPIKLDTFVMQSRTQWARLTRQLTGDQADAFLKIQRGGFAWGGKALLFDIGTHETMSIAAHEGWHQYTQRTFREQLPIWLEEGLATYMEGHRWDQSSQQGTPALVPVFKAWANTERFDQLRLAAAGNRLLPLPSLLDAAPTGAIVSASGQTGDGIDENLTYYAQVWALAHFLHEGAGGRYRAGLTALIADAAAGRMERATTAVAASRNGRAPRACSCGAAPPSSPPTSTRTSPRPRPNTPRSSNRSSAPAHAAQSSRAAPPSSHVRHLGGYPPRGKSVGLGRRNTIEFTMLLLGAGSMLPGWVVGPVAALVLIAIASHILAMHTTPMPVRRLHIRTVNGVLMMLLTSLLAYALGGLPTIQRPTTAPAETKLFLLVWFTIIGLVAMIVMLAVMDSLHTLTLSMRTRRVLREELRVRLSQAWSQRAGSTSPGHIDQDPRSGAGGE